MQRCVRGRDQRRESNLERQFRPVYPNRYQKQPNMDVFRLPLKMEN